jgi:ribosomal protein RSM22 (predicted rRNA methylase)
LSKIFAGSLLDLGAGPGTVWWAAQSIWNQEFSVTSVEREATFIELGKKLGAQTTWVKEDILSFAEFPSHDWIIFGYSLCELPQNALPSLLEKCWRASQKGIIFVEPGTPAHYQRLLTARRLLIQRGGFCLAPCPHSNQCPLPPNDWCHFSARLERSFLHTQAKSGKLPFEDEKFSYMIIVKEQIDFSKARIIRPPTHHCGHTQLSLCTSSGLQKITYSRKHKELYKKARKSTWGDLF